MFKPFRKLFYISCLTLFITSSVTQAQRINTKIYDIIDAVSAERIEADITTLANFGTRHTLSDTISNTRGIGAARRWIKSEFDKVSSNCNNCLEVFYQNNIVKEDGRRIFKDVNVVNVVAIQRGTTYPNRYVIMSGDIDSRVTDANDATSDSPGANDNASGMAGTIEAARVLSNYSFENSIIYVGLSGEEQGLYGGKGLAEYAKENDWDIIGVLNNDMIGNIEGVDGVIDNRTFRIFSEPYSILETEKQLKQKRFYGGENDGESRQLARHVFASTKTYLPEMNPLLIYRLDRFGRGGHHRPFNEVGFPGIRIMEAHENYNRQHQDIRTENGIDYGDVISGVNFEYCAKLTAVNAAALATLALAPAKPKNVKIGGIVKPSTILSWEKVDGAVAYKLYWRDTTAPTWQHFKWVESGITKHTLKGIVIDNFLFGVAAVGKDGHESMVAYPGGLIGR